LSGLLASDLDTSPNLPHFEPEPLREQALLGCPSPDPRALRV